MHPSRRAQLIATVLVAAVVARAPAEPVPSAPRGLPDPAAALLNPVASEPMPDITPRPVDATSVKRESAAQLTLAGESITTVRASEFEDSRRSGAADTEAARRRPADDAVDYLTDGRYRAGDRGRPERSVWDDTRAAADDARTDRFGGHGGDLDDPRFGEKTGSKLGSKLDDLFHGGADGKRRAFESDHEFDGFISPLTNPFLFEDPRSLTEVRGLVIGQAIPGDQPTFRGGSAGFFGGQGRLAFTDRLSVVVNKIGLSGFYPDGSSGQKKSTGLAELWLGPKYVFYRDPKTQTLLTAGATFQIPLGSSGVYQNTGKLSIVPYISAAQRLWETDWGTFNGMGSVGFAISTTRDRSNYFYASGHLDFDIMNKRRFYLLSETNWFSYTSNGRSRDFGVEGRDLANFGSAASGTNLVTWALGGKYKSESGRWEVGAAYELPVIGPRDLFRGRVTVDLIWRY